MSFCTLLIAAAFLGCVCVVDGAEDGTVRVDTVQSDRDGKRAGLGDRITITVTNFPAWIRELEERGKRPRNELVPFLDGIPLKGIYPEMLNMDQNAVRFYLNRTPESRDAWAALLGRPSWPFEKNVSVSIGLENGDALASRVEHGSSLCLIVIREIEMWAFAITLVVLLLWFFMNARNTSMLRDPGLGSNRPYSLAKTQMAVWFFLTFASFLFIFVVTHDYDSIPGSVFALMGISSVTGLGVLVQDAGKNPEITRRTLEKERNVLEGLPTKGPGDERRLLEIKEELKEKNPKHPESENFMRDVLTDAKGVSFHRFQMATWTVVLGVIFIVEVYRNLAMPEFGGTLLALMGISSGTYIGFMISEEHSSEQ